MTVKLFALSILLLASVARADSLTEIQIIKQLKQGAVLPLAPTVGDQLADNLIAAQLTYISYTQFEPDSLQLSIDSVLKAISLYVWPGGPTAITSEQAEPIVWEQSMIAIDTRVSVSISPTSIDFGPTPITTPEPSTLLLLFFPLLALRHCARVKFVALAADLPRGGSEGISTLH
jgi:hypothetical protein